VDTWRTSLVSLCVELGDLLLIRCPENCLIGAINADNGEANSVLNQETGEYGAVPTVGA
jgi:hypothetical protein